MWPPQQSGKETTRSIHSYLDLLHQGSALLHVMWGCQFTHVDPPRNTYPVPVGVVLRATTNTNQALHTVIYNPIQPTQIERDKTWKEWQTMLTAQVTFINSYHVHTYWSILFVCLWHSLSHLVIKSQKYINKNFRIWFCPFWYFACFVRSLE